MPNVNTSLRYNPSAVADRKNPADLTKSFRRKDNASFLAEVARRLQARVPGPAGTQFDPGGTACIGLIGEYGLIGYGIRGAQELIRVDHTPSYWSHAFLIASRLSTDEKVNRDPKKSAWLWESTLEPASLFNRFTDRNGVGPRRIADYAQAEFDLFSPHSVPNIAVIAIALTKAEREAVLNRADDPAVEQLRYDLPGLLGTWYGYLTNQADQPNPLSEGHAIYCSAYVQLAYEAAGVDLAPGAQQRNTSPEHLWQAAKYFQNTFRVLDPQANRLGPRPVRTWYCVRDPYCMVAPVGTELPGTITGLLNRI